MKTYILASLLSLYAFSSFAQIGEIIDPAKQQKQSRTDTNYTLSELHAQVMEMRLQLTRAGHQLKQYSALQYSGFALEIGGGALVLAGANVNAAKDAKNNPGNTLIYVGAGLGFVGTILQAASHASIAHAGNILISLTPQGLTVPLGGSGKRRRDDDVYR